MCALHYSNSIAHWEYNLFVWFCIFSEGERSSEDFILVSCECVCVCVFIAPHQSLPNSSLPLIVSLYLTICNGLFFCSSITIVMLTPPIFTAGVEKPDWLLESSGFGEIQYIYTDRDLSFFLAVSCGLPFIRLQWLKS